MFKVKWERSSQEDQTVEAGAEDSVAEAEAGTEEGSRDEPHWVHRAS